MSAPIESLSIENVVGSTGIDQEIDLSALSDALNGSDYDPDQFPGLIYRTDDPHATCLVFRSGKIVCTGATSIAENERAIQVLFGWLTELGLDVPDDHDLTIQNIVTSGDLGQALNLNGIAIGLGLETIEYEPEQFPGLVYRMSEPYVVALLFGSGKLVITGGTRPEDAENALEDIYLELIDLNLIQERS